MVVSFGAMIELQVYAPLDWQIFNVTTVAQPADSPVSSSLAGGVAKQ